MLTLFCQYFLRFWWWFLSKKTATKTRKCTFYQNAWTFCCSTLFIMFHCAQQRFLAIKPNLRSLGFDLPKWAYKKSLL